MPQAILSHLGPLSAGLRHLGIQPAFSSGSLFVSETIRIGVLLVIALALPNTLELLAAHEPALGIKPAKSPGRVVRLLTWQPNGIWAAGMACVAAAGMMSLGGLHAFVYWQF